MRHHVQLLSCLGFNHPQAEGWSLNGQVYFTSFCLPSSSTGLQTAFQSILPCCPSIESVFLIFCSRCSALHDFFQSSSFLITCPKDDSFLLLIMLCSLRSIPSVSKIPIRLFSSVSTIPLESFVCISSQKL